MKKDNQMTTDKNNNSKLRKFFIGVKNIIDATINLSAIVALVFAIMAFNNINNLNELKNYIKDRPNSHFAVVEWKKEFDNIRIGYSRDYVESVIGPPQIIEEFKLYSATYMETIYSNSYFTLFCIYEEDSSLLGYLIIGNDEDFRINNYRCNYSLFDYSINNAENYCFDKGVESILFLNFIAKRSSPLDENEIKLSSVVKAFESGYYSSNYVYDDIKNNIENLIEEAIKIRNCYPK